MFKQSIIKKIILIGIFLAVLIPLYVPLFNIVYSSSSDIIILDNEADNLLTRIDTELNERGLTYEEMTSLTVTGEISQNDLYVLSTYYSYLLLNIRSIDFSGAIAEECEIPANFMMYRDTLISFKAPMGITTICNYAFSYCSELREVVLPNSVENIWEYAFGYCTELTNIIIPDSVTYIDIGAFSDCTKLTEITIPNPAVTICDKAFYNCINVNKITIPYAASLIDNPFEQVGSNVGGVKLTFTYPSETTKDELDLILESDIRNKMSGNSGLILNEGWVTNGTYSRRIFPDIVIDDSIKVLVTGIWLDTTTTETEKPNLETVVVLTNLTNDKKYNGILKGSDTLIFKNIDYGTYKITCKNPLDINYVQSNVTNDEFTLEEHGEKTKEISITSQLTEKSGFYDIKEANNLIKYTETPRNDAMAPVISEIANMPKTFYITQSNNVDLSSYVTALDDIDGNITDKIVISSSPAFDKNNPGTYEITYNVKDNSNNAATPLKIKITIWNFVKIESGNYHTLALTTHGKLWSWGYNAEGQIGKGSSGNASTPVLLNLTDVVDIAANEYSSYAVTKDGQIYSWGYAGTGRLGDGTAVNRNYPRLVTMPDNTKFVKVSAEYESVAALTDAGDVYVWGGNGSGRLGLGTTTTVNTPTKLANLSNIVEIAQGGLAGAAIDNNGILYTWGSDATYNLLGDAANSGSQKLPGTYSGLTNMKYVELGRYHAIAISNSGQVYTWGEGANGKLGNAGTSNSSIPYATSITNGEQASANLYHSLVKASDGKLYVFGQNIYGKLGLGDATTRNVPTLNNNAAFISNGTGNVKWVSTMLDSSVILTEDTITKNNAVYGMGYNGSYQFGNGVIGDSNIPRPWTFTSPKAE